MDFTTKRDNGAALLLTCSIDIKGYPGIPRPEPLERQEDYLRSFSYWVQHQPGIRRVIFVENSNWPLDEFQKVVDRHNIHAKQIELISLDANNYDRGLGKGYGELLMIDLALEKSRLARDARYVVKLTGRAIVTNLQRLLTGVNASPHSKGFDFLCDMRDHGIYESLGLRVAGRWCDARLYAFTLRFHDEFLRGQYVRMDWLIKKQFLVEELLYEVVKRAPARARELGVSFKVVPRFPIEPWFVGSPAHWNKRYDDTRERAKRAVRDAVRRITPWLHL